MKKKIYIIGILALLSIAGCDDYLDKQPLDMPGSETFLSTAAEVEMGVNACYKLLDPDNTFSHRSYYRLFVALEDAGQIRMTNSLSPFREGNVNPELAPVRNFWTDCYTGISLCNIVIDGMEKARDQMHEAEWLGFKAEAQVIRAWCYYSLVVKFGDIPFTEHLLGMNDYADLARTPEDEIYDFIFKQMEEAAPNLPSTREGADAGRVTAGTAWAIAAKAAIYRAYFHNGKAISPDATYLNKVKAYTANCINTGGHELYYDSSNPKESYKNLFIYAGENCSEVLLQKEFNYSQNSSHDWLRTTGSRNYSSCMSGTTPQEYLIHSYEDTLGNTVDKSPYFDPKNPFFGREPRFYQTVVWPRVEGPEKFTITLTESNGKTRELTGFEEVFPGAKFPEDSDPTFMWEYNTLLKPWGEEEGVNYDQFGYKINPDGTAKILTNQDCTNAWSSRTGYLTWKYQALEDGMAGLASNGSLNMILLRYADVLLMRAEALIELNENLQEAVDLINQVRARGWGMSLAEYASHPSAKTTALGQEGLRALVRRERKIELCHEGHRYEDLKRYGATVKALGMDVVGRPKYFHKEAETNIPQIDANGVVSLPWLEGLDGQAPDYPNRWWMSSNYKDFYDRWPIPQTEFDNGNLDPAAQNPGY